MDCAKNYDVRFNMVAVACSGRRVTTLSPTVRVIGELINWRVTMSNGRLAIIAYGKDCQGTVKSKTGRKGWGLPGFFIQSCGNSISSIRWSIEQSSAETTIKSIKKPDGSPLDKIYKLRITDTTGEIFNKEFEEEPDVKVECSEECPAGTCEVDCGDRYCCYNSEGIAVKSIKK